MCNKNSEYESFKVQNNQNVSINELIRTQVSRRDFLKGILVVPLGTLESSDTASRFAFFNSFSKADPSLDQSFVLGFQSLVGSKADKVSVPPGYESQVIIRWGDPLFSDVSLFNLDDQTPEAQSRQFGYNCDFIGYFPLPHHSIPNGHMGLLCVNHEYTMGTAMFPGYDSDNPTRVQVDTEISAHGMTVVEVRQDRKTKKWQYTIDSSFNRRITGETLMKITGPAAGHSLLQTSADPSGLQVRGMFNNCGGGKTPWGTILTCEENFNQYFANNDILDDLDPRKSIHNRYGIPRKSSRRKWERFHSRFDVSQEPNEPFRSGWVVEIDPYNPNSVPRKRTALGRIKHEAATVVVAPSGRIVVYSGDDEQFDYMYKFVSSNSLSPLNSDANSNLLDDGTLYVALFNDDGSGQWLPLIQGYGKLTAEHGFKTQGDILINTRGAADLLGATPMDRPEDIEVNPVNGKVYCVMTNNSERGARGKPAVDGANPRSQNRYGHIIELTEDINDHAALWFTWKIFMLCGDPSNPDHKTFFQQCDPRVVSPISSPDNIVFDKRGNLWITTDGMKRELGINDGVFACSVIGADRGCVKQFLSAPIGSEVTGPELNSTNTTIFVSIQHPGGGDRLKRSSSTWPDGDFPRPSVVAVIKREGELDTIGA